MFSDTQAFLNFLYTEQPRLHRGETEVARSIARSESLLRDEAWNAISWDEPACYGISRDLAEYLHQTVQDGWRTLETGSGLSTLIFARCRAWHTAVTPNCDELSKLEELIAYHAINPARLTLVCEASETFLPSGCPENLDCVLLDGKHAFPWPILDWFYSACRLKRGGLMILDDIDLTPVKILVNFLALDDPRWEPVRRFERSAVFRKCTDCIQDVTWHMQRFVLRH